LPPGLDLREEKDGHFSIPDLIKVEVTTLNQAYEQLLKGL